MTLSQLFPALQPFVAHLVKVWPAYDIKANFAIWEVFHIVSVVTLGGASALVGLRILGVGLIERPTEETYRGLSHLITLGVLASSLSGLLIGMANAERLYDSAAFLAKIMALAGGIVLSFKVLGPVALEDKSRPASTIMWAGLGLGLWALSMAVLATGGLVTPGLLHVLSAASLIVLVVTQGKSRCVYGAGCLAILAAMAVATNLVFSPDDMAHIDLANLVLSGIWGLWVLGFAIQRGRVMAQEGGPSTFGQTIAYAQILVWVTAAAGGRWIAFA
jgi:uncharacterized membrane protein YecN with MAPEG domain